MTVLLAEVKNTSDSIHSIELVKIIVEGKDGEDIAVMNSIIGEVGLGGDNRIKYKYDRKHSNCKRF